MMRSSWRKLARSRLFFGDTDNLAIVDFPDNIGAAAIGAVDPIRSEILWVSRLVSERGSYADHHNLSRCFG